MNHPIGTYIIWYDENEWEENRRGWCIAHSGEAPSRTFGVLLDAIQWCVRSGYTFIVISSSLNPAQAAHILAENVNERLAPL